jgi:hypothetical protein
MRWIYVGRMLALVLTTLGAVTTGAASAHAAFDPYQLPAPQPKLVVGSMLGTDGQFPINFTWPDFDRTNLCWLGWEENYAPAVNGPVDSGDLPLIATSYVLATNYGVQWAFSLDASTCDEPGVVYGGAGIELNDAAYNQTSAKFGTGWTTQPASSAYGSDQTYSTKAGATATITKTFANFGIVAGEGPNGGSFAVYVDGVKKAAVSLHSTSYKSRQVVWKTGYANNQTHTIKIVNTSSTTANRVTLDAFVTISRCQVNCTVG